MILSGDMGIPAVDAAEHELKAGAVAGGNGAFIVLPAEKDLFFADVALSPGGRVWHGGAGILHQRSLKEPG